MLSEAFFIGLPRKRYVLLQRCHLTSCSRYFCRFEPNVSNVGAAWLPYFCQSFWLTLPTAEAGGFSLRRR